MRPDYEGTEVLVELGTASGFDLAEALALEDVGFAEWGYVDTVGERSGGVVTVKLAEHQAGVGSRDAARPLRIRCANLLRADRTLVVVFDWSRIEVAASSFVDECAGMLGAEFGPGRVNHTNMQPLIQRLAGTVVQRRSMQ